METLDALVIGAGPAGLMAAQTLAAHGRQVTLLDAMRSPARKFLMAGKSGLNLCKDESLETSLLHFYDAAETLRPMLSAFDSEAVQQWARELGQEVFTGSSGRVFPKSMKASPLLRAWLHKLDSSGVDLRRQWRWLGFEGETLTFSTPLGERQIKPAVTILALGGSSWSRLGSTGQWTSYLSQKSVELTSFSPANAALLVPWSPYMQPYFGSPIKGVRLHHGSSHTRAEFIVSKQGLEGSAIYTASRSARLGQALTLDLFPDTSEEQLRAKLQRPKGKASFSNYLRKTIGLGGAKLALAREFCHPLPTNDALAPLLKNMTISHNGLADIDQAISTAGGVSFKSLDNDLMLKNMPSFFCAGEMLDWEAPTGGYLINASLATGRWAALAAAKY